ncbi:hypothetical protein [Methylocapsa sp. S129]|uniref:hypothetical protein n=1 Tax=Methylocapsa sp. S129 TaxID=1641869 RepID=UPI00131E98DF|nr:hypothetical protein [Methylocapsa sp. S129]
MKRLLRPMLTAGSLAAAGLIFAGAALAHDRHADGSSTTQAAACKLALQLARQGVANDQVTASHCECLENKEDHSAPWSCTGFVSYR